MIRNRPNGPNKLKLTEWTELNGMDQSGLNRTKEPSGPKLSKVIQMDRMGPNRPNHSELTKVD